MTKHVLITGAASGFGECLALSYSQAGWNVTATMRDPQKASARLGELDSVRVARLDVTDPASIREALEVGTEAHGPVDVLANVAAYALTGTLEETTLEQIAHAFETNVLGTLAVTKAVLPGMRERRAGHVIAFSSATGVVAMPTFPTYVSTKFAIEGFFEALSYDLAHLGVQVTVVEPGAFSTQLGAKGVAPAARIAEYAPAAELLPEMFDFSPGDLDAASDVVVGVSGAPDAPLHLYLGHGLDNVRRRCQQRLDGYASYEHLTARTARG